MLYCVIVLCVTIERICILLPAMMKAALCDAAGVLRLVDVPTPQANAGEVLLRVRACGLSRLDVEAGAAVPRIAGSGCVGEIVQIGAEVVDFEAGQRVAVAPFLADGSPSSGGLAQYAVAPATNLVLLPDDMDDADAVACASAMLAAWHMLVTKAGIHPGQTVLIGGAGGGVGCAAVAAATLWGARVIAAAGSAAKLARTRELGADEAINSAEEDVAAVVRELTDGRGADIVVDFVGAATWPGSIAAVAAGGIIVTCGAFTGTHAPLDIGELARKQILIVGGRGGTGDELTEVLRLVGDGRLDVTIDHSYPLAEIAAAQARLVGRESIGRIVILP